MEPDKMLEELTEKKEALETQLVDLERIFNEKREQYLKILGAIEALENLDPSLLNVDSLPLGVSFNASTIYLMYDIETVHFNRLAPS